MWVWVWVYVYVWVREGKVSFSSGASRRLHGMASPQYVLWGSVATTTTTTVDAQALAGRQRSTHHVVVLCNGDQQYQASSVAVFDWRWSLSPRYQRRGLASVARQKRISRLTRRPRPGLRNPVCAPSSASGWNVQSGHAEAIALVR